MGFREQEDELDLRARAELSLAYDPGQPPAHLFRKTPLLRRRGMQRVLALLLVIGACAGTVLTIRPPELVRAAIDHEYYERTLRGNFMEGTVLAERLGLGRRGTVPGYPQLMRPCEIEGRLAFHFTTFFEKGGMVTVFAFDAPVPLQDESGWWGNVHWEVAFSEGGKPLILIAQKPNALAAARDWFARVRS